MADGGFDLLCLLHNDCVEWKEVLLLLGLLVDLIGHTPGEHATSSTLRTTVLSLQGFAHIEHTGSICLED
jgi:hypothetical protein